MSAWHSELPAPDDKPQPIILYYKNVMSSSYREDEKAIKDIVKRGVETMTPEQNVKLVVYYKPEKASPVQEMYGPEEFFSCVRVQLSSWGL